MGNILLEEVMIIFGLSIAVLLLCHRLGIPSIVGFLLTGVICGPSALGLVKLNADVQTLADLGVILLLFSVGIEFSIKRLLSYTRFFFVGGGIQVILTALVGFCFAKLLGRPAGESLFLGFLLSLSSTAIVLRILDTNQETTTTHGKATLSMLIFQDIAAVPMMLMTPFLAGSVMEFEFSFLYSLGLGILLLAVVFFAALKIIPVLMFHIAGTRNRELFLLTTLCLCFSVAWITASMGLSLSLGAFLAGLLVSETEYRNEAIEDIIPLQDIFTSFFFISIGMLLDIDFLIHNPNLVILSTCGVILLKTVIATTSTLIVGMPLRTALIVGLTVSQVGEFSFVLAQSGMKADLASPFYYQLFLAIAVLTMAITPFLMQIAPYIATAVQKLPLPLKLIHGFHPIPSERASHHNDHVVIIGLGIPGKMLAHSCTSASIPYTVVEMDPVKVREERSKGGSIFYGDATHTSVLREAGVKSARAVAVLTNDRASTIRIVDHIRRLNQDAYIVVRARLVEEVQPLLQHKADEVIPDEFGSSVEIFTRIMHKYHIDNAFIDDIVQERRREGYELLRFNYKEQKNFFDDDKKNMPGLAVESFRVLAASHLIGKTLQESQLREEYGVTVLMIKRGVDSLVSLKPGTVLNANDVLVLVGTHKDIRRVGRELFKKEDQSSL